MTKKCYYLEILQSLYYFVSTLVCKLWKNFLESPRISIKYAQELPEKHKNQWNFWINATKDSNFKSTVEKLLTNMLKSSVLRTPIYMAMTSGYYRRHIYNLFEYIFPLKTIKCPICDEKWEDLKVKKSQNPKNDAFYLLKRHILDHLCPYFNQNLDFVQWAMPKLEYLTKKSYDPNHPGLSWVYNCTTCTMYNIQCRFQV